MANDPSDHDALPRRKLLSTLGMTLGAAALTACSRPSRAEHTGTASAALTSGANVASVDVVAELALLGGGAVGSADPAIAIVQGYLTNNDGGGGVFTWVDAALVVQPLAADQGTIFPVTAGTGGWWVRIFSGPVDIRWFGARADDPAAAATNSAAFALLQSAIVTGIYGWGRGIYVPPGDFHLADDLTVIRSVDLFGDGIQSKSRLVLAAGKSVIVDSVYGSPIQDTGYESQIRDLQIISAGGFTYVQGTPFAPNSFTPAGYEGKSNGTAAIVVNAPAYIARVFISGFSGTAIYIVGDGVTTNCNQWRIHDVFISNCGGHGVHVDGGEAQGGHCSGVKAIAIGGTGFYESSLGGNTYVGCYAEEVAGRGYSSDTPGQATFIGCFAEAQAPTRLASFGTLWFGGSIGEVTPDSTAFIAENVGLIRPFTSTTGAPEAVRFFSGNGVAFAPEPPRSAFGWTTSYTSTNVHWNMTWAPAELVWSLEGSYSAALRASYLTTGYNALEHARGVGLQGFPAMLLGPATSGNIKISVDTGPSGSGEPGDRIYNTSPSVGSPSGWIWAEDGGVWGWHSLGNVVA